MKGIPLTWRIAVTTGHFLPVDPEHPVLNRIDVADDEIDSERVAEEQRQAAAKHRIDPDAHVHMLGVPNEGMMAGQPTNCYLLGRPAHAGFTLIDAGSEGSDDVFSHAFAEGGLDPRKVERIVLTHCHPDHVGGAAKLKEMTGAPVYAPPLEREQIERFAPDLKIDGWLDHEAAVDCGDFSLEPIFTPGHAPGHLAFRDSETNMLIAGDMISGFGSVGIFPPNGSVADYLDSLRRLLAIHDADPFTAILPGHGPVIAEVREKIEGYISHRLEREQTILTLVQERGPSSVEDLFPLIYPDILPHLGFAGKATITMHLQKLVDEKLVSLDEDTYRAVD